MGKFESVLEECLQALHDGRADIDACLRRYPAHADALRPHLIAASKLISAYGETQPSAKFATDARERFLIASGQRLQEAFDIDPSPSFFASARVKFLMAAQRMKLGERAQKTHRLPVFGAPRVFDSPFRALAGAGAAMAVFLGLSAYTVASASAAVPGEWRYGVKLQTERVRLALAFTEDAKQDVRLDIAEERVEEIQELTVRGKIIGPGVIDRLKEQTAPLGEDLDALDSGELARVRAIAEKSKTVLDEATPQVAPAALLALAETKQIVEDAALGALVRIDGPRVIPPQIALPAAEATETPGPTETSDGRTPTATPAGSGTGIEVDPEPAGVDLGVTWMRIVVGRFSTLIPSGADGWQVAGVNTAGGSGPTLVRISNADGTQIISFNPRNGDAYWFVAINGVFDEVQLRMERDGQMFIADRALLEGLYGSLAEIPLYIVDHIEIEPEPAPPPQPTQESLQ